MTEVSLSRHCSECGKKKRFIKQKLNTFLGLILTVCTLGLFLIVWLPLIVWQTFRPYRCVECGSTRRF